MLTIENSMAYIGIFLFCVTIINYAIVLPQNKSNAELRSAIAELRVTIKQIDDECRMRTERLVRVEASAKQAHKRIDTLENRFNDDEKNKT